MNKTAIKNFAVWARNKLIADITYKAGLIGVSEKGIAQPLPQFSKDLQFFDIGTKDYAQVAGKDIEQRNALVRAIQEKERASDYQTALKSVVEEVAYTWFNRLIAIRFMEVNDYLPSRIRVLSSENPAKNEPDFVTTPFDTDMEFTMAEQDKIMQLKDENKLDELFRMLFIKQCNKLHEILPELFEKTNDYTELLLSISFTDRDGVVYHLVHDIDESDFDITTQDEYGKTPGQVEIIGWMYQFYNIEPKAEVFSKKGKVKKEEVPAATQLFTPDWIVRYMVENSLGRLWVEGHPSDSLKENWQYYLEEAKQEASILTQLEQIRSEYRNLNPEDIKVIDPCMGSGHILVYCFDVLMQIYESQGYTQRDAAQSILENNLFGLDIDERAAQLAYFAVMMKARQYDRRIFNREIKPHVYAIEESNGINRGQMKYFGAGLSPIERNKAKLQITGLLDTMVDAKEYGSILDAENFDWDLLRKFASQIDDAGQMTLDTIGIDDTQKRLEQLIDVAIVMSPKYDVTITNPPYMAISNASPKLSDYVKLNYPDEKVDMYTVFISKCGKMTKKNAYQAMITQHGWMFLGSFEKMREKKLRHDIVNMAHLGARAFEEIGGEVVQTVAFVFRISSMPEYVGTYSRLVEPNTQSGKENLFLKRTTLHKACRRDFNNIPGSPVAYWISEQLGKAFSDKLLGDYAYTKQGFATGSNDLFLRFWHEVGVSNTALHTMSREAALNSNYKWFPCNKGGSFRKWYGNNIYVANWENNGAEMTAFDGSVIRNPQFYFLEGITWSSLANQLSFRYSPEGFLFESKGSMCYSKGIVDVKYLLALLNSKIASEALSVLSPTLDFHEGPMAKVPVIVLEDKLRNDVISVTEDNIRLAKEDWDSFESSWDFGEHPLVRHAKGLWDATAVGAAMHYYYNSHPTVSCPLELCFILWQGECNERFNELKRNEEELNKIFIGIYGLNDELTSDVEDNDVTVRKADLGRDIRSLISYAVGCMFGRYSLDKTGAVCVGTYLNNNDYSSFMPDKDNCIPVTDEEYLEDDIVGRFCEWLKVAFGEESLEANLTYIAKALGNKGTTSREVIRNYFLSDFMKDHIKMYQKRPIYWLFDSGKQNGFKALVYMHRWNADTVGNLRVEYLHKMQHTYEREIIRMQETIDNSRDSREVSRATKRKDKLQKQLKETKDYDAMLAHIALSRIEIDLDDGVKVNYEKVQTGRDGKKMQILAKL